MTPEDVFAEIGHLHLYQLSQNFVIFVNNLFIVF